MRENPCCAPTTMLLEASLLCSQTPKLLSYPVYSNRHLSRGKLCCELQKFELIVCAEKPDHEEVVSVFPDPLLQLHTTRSWDFLKAAIDQRTRAPHPHHNHKSSDVIIGIIDTGWHSNYFYKKIYYYKVYCTTPSLTNRNYFHFGLYLENWNFLHFLF